MGSREVRDAIHGLVELAPLEWQVVDSPAFQRLRGVQQLAATNLVYPGARHTRFEHCIGACHIAGRLADSIGLDPPTQENVRMAALCHDLGHGPFSHVSEFVFEARTKTEHVHERISGAIVRHHAPIRDALGTARAEWVAELLEVEGHGRRRTAERDIIAGPADIDKLDYLLRDSHYCGVEYGRYDLDKVIESARLVQKQDGSYLAYHEDGIFAVEGMLLARHHMHRQVYGHKTRIATDRMLMRALEFGIDEGALPAQVFVPTVFDADFVDEYLQWDDQRVTSVLCNDSGKGGEIMRSLKSRSLLKRVLRLSMQDLLRADMDRMTVGYAIEPGSLLTPEMTKEAEQLIAAAAGVDPMWVVLHWEELQNPISRSFSARILDKEILLTNDDNEVEAFSEKSELFGQVGPSPQRYVSVYIRPDPDTPVANLKVESQTAKAVREASVTALEAIGAKGRTI